MYLEIAIDTPLRRTFDYRCPVGVATTGLRPGLRIRVPFGRRRVVGLLLKVKPVTEIPDGKLKSAIEVLDDEPVFDRELLALLTWSADYYRHPVGEVIASALPNSLRAGSPLFGQRKRWRLTELGKLEWSSLPVRSTRLRALAEALLRSAHPEELSQLQNWRAGLRDFEERGWALSEVEVETAAAAPAINNDVHRLTDAQRAAVEKILIAQGRFRSWLLHGITGSGKTEVYLSVIQSVIGAGKQALVLVPEIALTPQLIARFEDRFSAPLAVLHSALSDGERLRAWRDARAGAAPIVIGTRSAVFAPLKSLGVIVVDEEHDASYKQQEGFRYSARDLAIVRAQRLDIPVILGSATPSLESLARAKKNPHDLLVLANRAGNAVPPQIRLVDLRKNAQTDGIATPTILSINAHLDAGGQVLLYLNRRGYAPTLFCPACGWSALCNRCDARMTVHRRAAKLICHHCGAETGIVEQCPSCDALTKPVGQGTERIETAIANLFPQIAIARVDRDVIRRKHELKATLDQIQSGAARILIGTQMLTKGHHFPNVTLVVVLNADQGLFGADFRAAERLAQSIVQVAGRAGRAERTGEVLIQTEYPEHPLLVSLLRDGYSAFADKALAEREAGSWPPFARLALIRADATSLHYAMNFLQAASAISKELSERSIRVFGPVAAPMQKRAGRYRAQLLFHAPSHTPLQALLSRLLPRLDTLHETKRVRWSIDVDPAELF